EELGRLRQGVERARGRPRRHDVVARALRRREREERGLDLHEAARVEVVPHGLRGAVAQQEWPQRLGPADVEVAVAQPQLLADLRGVDAAVDEEGRGLGGREDLDLLGHDLDQAGGSGALLARRALAHGALDRHDVLAAQGLRDVERLRGLRLADDLHEAGAVAEFDEHQAAEVAAAVDPALEHDRLPGVLGAELAAHVTAGHAENSSRARRSSSEAGRCSPVARSLSCQTPAARSLAPLRAAWVAPRLSASARPLPGARRW